MNYLPPPPGYAYILLIWAGINLVIAIALLIKEGVIK